MSNESYDDVSEHPSVECAKGFPRREVMVAARTLRLIVGTAVHVADCHST